MQVVVSSAFGGQILGGAEQLQKKTYMYERRQKAGSFQKRQTIIHIPFILFKTMKKNNIK